MKMAFFFKPVIKCAFENKQRRRDPGVRFIRSQQDLEREADRFGAEPEVNPDFNLKKKKTQRKLDPYIYSGREINVAPGPDVTLNPHIVIFFKPIT